LFDLQPEEAAIGTEKHLSLSQKVKQVNIAKDPGLHSEHVRKKGQTLSMNNAEP
jgi:hypothetical protein